MCPAGVKDIEFEANQVIVRDGKGMKDRVTMLPTGIKPALLKASLGLEDSVPGEASAEKSPPCLSG